MTHRNPWPRCAELIVLFVCTLGMSHQLLAQQAGQAPPPASSPTQPATPPTPAATPQTQPSTPPTQTPSANDSGATGSQSAPDPKVPQNDRILWTLPNYLTVENASSLPPLTAGQKFKLEAQGAFDPVEFVFIGAEAGLNQASNANPTFGQGLIGYSKRYALQFGDNTIENFMVGAVYAVAFRQDPRYYQMGKGSFFHRVWYAGLHVLINRSDAGKPEFNFPEILGGGTAAAISNAYHPGPRTLGSNVNVWAAQIAYDAFGYEMKEFWPDVHRFLKHGNNKP